MSVDKTIEELSYTLAQLGTLVGHINSQIGQLASRINITLDTFDQSVAGIAFDANLVSTHVAHTVSQAPNGWLFYLLFLSIIVVFLLLSVVLILNMITRCHGLYTLIKGSTTTNYAAEKQNGFLIERPEQEEYGFRPEKTFRRDHVSIPMDMEQEPRRVGFVSNGDLKKRRSLTESRRPYEEYPSSVGNGQYNNVGIARPFTNAGAEV